MHEQESEHEQEGRGKALENFSLDLLRGAPISKRVT